MTYLRGSPEDFDHWAAAGNAGCSYAECLPYFKRAETHQLGESEYQGGSGLLGIQKNILRNPLSRAWIEGARQAGYRINPDFNGPIIEGFGPSDQNIKAGRRSSPASAYLHPIRARRNLTITINVLVIRILTEGKRATGSGTAPSRPNDNDEGRSRGYPDSGRNQLALTPPALWHR
jgi:choline dehydrogenase